MYIFYIIGGVVVVVIVALLRAILGCTSETNQPASSDARQGAAPLSSYGSSLETG